MCSSRRSAATPTSSCWCSRSRSKPMTHIAFLGVGAMGLGMAARLAGSGQKVVAYDVSGEALARAEAAVCEAAGSAAEAVNGASVVVTMLATGVQVAAAY